MYRKFRHSLQWKLVLLISGIVAVVIAVIGSISYDRSRKAIDADVVRFSNQILTQANFNLSRYFDDNEQFFNRVANSPDFRNWASVTNGSTYSIFEHYRSIETNFIRPFVAYHPETFAVVLYSSNGYQNIYWNADNAENMLSTTYKMENEPWFYELPFTGEVTRMVKLDSHYINKSGFPVNIPVLTYVQKFSFGDHYAYLQFDISLQSTQAILDEIKLGDHGSTFIVDQDGTIVSAHEQATIGQVIHEDLQQVLKDRPGSSYMKNTKQMVVYQSIPRTGWKIVSLISYSDLARSIANIRDWTTGMTLLGIVISSFLVFLVASSITRRLKELRKTIGMTRLGMLDVRVKVKGNDEVAELGGAYNHLLDRIDVSIHQLAESRTVQQQAILSALQAQVNSHFLYNAMESINSMANLARHKGIMDTTIALSSMLRYTSNYQQALVALEDEMKHVSDYIHIIQILYRDEVQFQIAMEEEVRGARTLKAIIQPFVENSVKHGYETTGEPMMIRITAKPDGEAYVRVDIEDNGRGFSADKFQELQAALALRRPPEELMQLSRIGVLNVHYRLRTFYKDSRSGVSLSTTENGGTCISIVFPYSVKEVS